MNLQHLLQDVLKFIVSGDYYHQGEWIVFGWEAYLREHSRTVLDDRRPSEIVLDEQRKELSRQLASLTRTLTRTREGLSPTPDTTVQEIWKEFRNDEPDLVHWGTELYYATTFISSLSDIAHRSVSLDIIEPKSVPSPEELNHLLREATTCYVYGLFDATIMLCRSCLQRALEIRIQRDLPRLTLEILRKECWLDSLITTAEQNHLFAVRKDAAIARDLDTQTEKLDAHVNSDKCYEMLFATRKLVASLC